MAPKWETGDIAGIQQNGWKHYQPITAKNQPMEEFLNTFTHEGTPWWEWETNEAIRLAQAGKDKKAIVKSINQKRKNHYDSTHKDKVKQTAQAKKAQTYVAPVKHTKAQGEEIKLNAEETLRDTRQTLKTKYNREMPDNLDSMDWTTHQYDPRLLLCSISYPDFNRRVFETGVGGGQDIMTLGNESKYAGIMGEVEKSDENNITLGRRQGGVQRIYPYGPPKRRDPSTWGHNSKTLNISEWDWKQEHTGYEKTYKGVGELIHETHELSFNQEPNQIKLDPGTLELTTAQFRELKRRYETRRNWFYQLLPTRKSVEGAIWLGLDELKSNVEDGAPISKITMEQDDRYAEEVEKDRAWVWTIGSQGGQLDAKFTHGGFHWGRAELYLDLPVNQTGGIRQLPPIGVLVHNPTGLVYLQHSDKLDYFGTLRHTISSLTGEAKFENDNPILLKQNFAKDHIHLGENIFMNRVLNLRGHREIDIMGVSYGVSSGINMRIDHLTYRTKFGDVGGRYHELLKDFYRKHHIHNEVTIEEMVNQTIMKYVKYDKTKPRGWGTIKLSKLDDEDGMNRALKSWDVPEGYGVSPDVDEEDPIEEEEENVEDEPPMDSDNEVEEEPEPENEDEPASERLYHPMVTDMFAHKDNIYKIVKYDVGTVERVFAIDEYDPTQVWDLGTINSNEFEEHDTAFLEEHGLHNFEKLEGIKEPSDRGYIQMRDLEQTTHYKTSEGPTHNEIITRIGKKEVKPTQAKEKKKKEKKKVKKKKSAIVPWDTDKPHEKELWEYMMEDKGSQFVDMSKEITRPPDKHFDEETDWYGLDNTKLYDSDDKEGVKEWLDENGVSNPSLRKRMTMVLIGRYKDKKIGYVDVNWLFQIKPDEAYDEVIAPGDESDSDSFPSFHSSSSDED